MSYCESDRECAVFQQRLAEVERDYVSLQANWKALGEAYDALQRETAELKEVMGRVRQWMDAHPRKATIVESLKNEIRRFSNVTTYDTSSNCALPDRPVPDVLALERELAAVRGERDNVRNAYHRLTGGDVGDLVNKLEQQVDALRCENQQLRQQYGARRPYDE